MPVGRGLHETFSLWVCTPRTLRWVGWGIQGGGSRVFFNDTALKQLYVDKLAMINSADITAFSYV